MNKENSNALLVKQFAPKYSRAIYNTKIDVIGKHLSGLLLVKKMPDSSTRIVFSNEMGLKFFDFEFKENGDFKVYSIFKQMNKKAVIKTLRHDFELLLMNNLKLEKSFVVKDSTGFTNIFPQSRGFYTYKTNLEKNVLLNMQRTSKNKTITEIIIPKYNNEIPDSIAINHKKFNFTIGLKLLQDVTEE